VVQKEYEVAAEGEEEEEEKKTISDCYFLHLQGQMTTKCHLLVLAVSPPLDYHVIASSKWKR
jgi:hypothetical protein